MYHLYLYYCSLLPCGIAALHANTYFAFDSSRSLSTISLLEPELLKGRCIVFGERAAPAAVGRGASGDGIRVTGDVDYAKLESEIAARKVAEVVVPRTQLADMRADIEFLRAAQEAADAMVHQHQLVRMWLDIERRLEEAKVGLRVEFWEVGLRLEHEIFWTKVNCLPPASQEVFFLRADAEHVLQRQQQQQQQQKSESEVELGGADAGGAKHQHACSGGAILAVGIAEIFEVPLRRAAAATAKVWWRSRR